MLHGMSGTEESHATKNTPTLVHGVSGSLEPRIWRFIDEHGMHGHDVWAYKTLHIVQNLWQTEIATQNWVTLWVEESQHLHELFIITGRTSFEGETTSKGAIKTLLCH